MHEAYYDALRHLSKQRLHNASEIRRERERVVAQLAELEAREAVNTDSLAYIESLRAGDPNRHCDPLADEALKGN